MVSRKHIFRLIDRLDQCRDSAIQTGEGQFRPVCRFEGFQDTIQRLLAGRKLQLDYAVPVVVGIIEETLAYFQQDRIVRLFRCRQRICRFRLSVPDDIAAVSVSTTIHEYATFALPHLASDLFVVQHVLHQFESLVW